jgi:hypothetical protein
MTDIKDVRIDLLKIRVENMESRNGNKVPNQFVINAGSTEYFQSYNTVIVARNSEGTFLDSDAWNYSRTTSKYRSEFLGESTKETEKKIKNGTYALVNLN